MRIGVDLGGTKIEGIALSPTGEILSRHRRPTPRDDYIGTIGAVVDLVTQLEAETKQTGRVGIGMPGAISPQTGLVKNANSTWLIGRPFAEDLTGALGRPLRLANDANCFALSESIDGAAAGKPVVFGVILGTGVGGGVVVAGRPLVGYQAIAGEWGHNPLPWPEPDEWPGAACYCGRRGCIETFLSGPALMADFRRTNGTDLAPEEIVRSAVAGDLAAEAMLERYEDRLAKALASVINILDPDVIVLGGGLSNIDRLFRNLPALLPRHVFSDRCDTPVLPPKHGDSSGVRGAAWLWPPSDG